MVGFVLVEVKVAEAKKKMFLLFVFWVNEEIRVGTGLMLYLCASRVIFFGLNVDFQFISVFLLLVSGLIIICWLLFGAGLFYLLN